MPAAKKFAAKTHLSPSRRRAVCRGNRETRSEMKPGSQDAPLLGLESPGAVSHCERNCEGMKQVQFLRVHITSTATGNIAGNGQKISRKNLLFLHFPRRDAP